MSQIGDEINKGEQAVALAWLEGCWKGVGMRDQQAACLPICLTVIFLVF